MVARAGQPGIESTRGGRARGKLDREGAAWPSAQGLPDPLGAGSVMSYDQLSKLNQLMAFDPRPLQDWFVATHVPFDDLFETNTVETRVRETAAAGGRVSVIGTSGTGKTSLVEHALSADGLLPIWMHVAVEKPELVVDP